jgi:hypothetical protein
VAIPQGYHYVSPITSSEYLRSCDKYVGNPMNDSYDLGLGSTLWVSESCPPSTLEAVEFEIDNDGNVRDEDDCSGSLEDLLASSYARCSVYVN